MTYTIPIADSTGEVIGVIGADVTLDTLASIVSNIKPFPNSFCTLVAGDGTVIVAPPTSAKKIGKCHVYTEMIEDKNMTLTITIPDSDMYHRLRQNKVTLDMNVENNAIKMKISDKGIPFNPLEKETADLNVSLEERKIGGLGIYLIKEIMDKVDYEYKDGSISST